MKVRRLHLIVGFIVRHLLLSLFSSTCLITVPPSYNWRNLNDDRDAPEPITTTDHQLAVPKDMAKEEEKEKEEEQTKEDGSTVVALPVPVRADEGAKDGGGCYNCK